VGLLNTFHRRLTLDQASTPASYLKGYFYFLLTLIDFSLFDMFFFLDFSFIAYVKLLFTCVTVKSRVGDPLIVDTVYTILAAKVGSAMFTVAI